MSIHLKLLLTLINLTVKFKLVPLAINVRTIKPEAFSN